MNKTKKNVKINKKNFSFNNYWWQLVVVIFWIYLVFGKIKYFQYMPLPFTLTKLFEEYKWIDANKLRLIVRSFSVALFSLIGCYGYGSIICKNLLIKFEDDKSFILSLILGFGLMALMVYILGLLGLIYKSIFLIIIIIGIIIAFINFKKFSCILIKPNFNFFQTILFFIFVYTAGINLIGTLTPETFFDSQFYLLGLPNQWRLQHKISFNKYIFASMYPFNINMLYLLAITLNDDISAKLIHWFCGIICCFTIYTFVKKYFSKTVALIAVLIFYTVPTLMAVSWKTAIELGIAMFETAMVLCMVEYVINRDKLWLIWCGIFAGFSVGSKYLSLVEVFSISLSFFMFNLIIDKEKISDIAKNYLYFLLPAITICLPWYLRNLIITGNPVFPFFADKIGFIKPRVVGNIFADPPFPKFSFKNYFLFLWPLTLGQLQQESYPGGIFLVFLPFLFLFKNVDKKMKFISIYVIICLFLWCVVGRFYLRYFIPVLSVVAILYAYFIEENKLPKWFKNLTHIIFIFIIFSNINFAMRILHFTQTPAHFVFTNMSKKEYLSTQRPSYPCPYYQVADWVNKNLPKNVKLLLLGETRGLFFERQYVTHGVLEYSPLIENLKKVQSASQLYEEFKKQGITHVVLNVPEAKRLSGYDNFYFEPEEFKIWCEFWNKYVKEIYRDVADIALPDRGIYSLKKQSPNLWKQYASNPMNYVYLYEIMSEEEAEKPHQPPYNFFLHKEIYSQERWEKLKPVIDEILADYKTKYER
ncbi:MAG: glycosyltransferase family 39 protein [Candidatus Pacearchaeota archaeon]